MRYTEQGHPVFKKLGPRATFANVCETAQNMGYAVDVAPERLDWVRLSWWEKEQYESRPIRMNEFINYLNDQLVERGYIKQEIEI